MSRFKQRQETNEAADGNGWPSAAATSDPEAPEDDVEMAADETQVIETVVRPSVGEHVEAVLKAAEDAAERLVEDARMRAIAIRADAEREASSHIDAAHVTAARLTEQAEAAHSEALASAERVRAAAEGDAVDVRAEAEEEAAKLRADAERDAATMAERTTARHEELLNDTALAEDRLRRLVDGLRDVADRLDGLLQPTADEQAREPALPEQEPSSLEDALDPGQTKRSSRPE
jgi:hypothetical protein